MGELKRHRGQPTKYKPEYCAKIVEYMAQGHFLVEFAAEVNSHMDSLYEWQDKHPEFSLAVKKAKALCLKWWIAEGKRMSTVPGAQQDSKVWLYIMNNLHGWGEKVNVEHSGKIGSQTELTDEQLTSLINSVKEKK